MLGVVNDGRYIKDTADLRQGEHPESAYVVAILMLNGLFRWPAQKGNPGILGKNRQSVGRLSGEHKSNSERVPYLWVTAQVVVSGVRCAN